MHSEKVGGNISRYRYGQHLSQWNFISSGNDAKNSQRLGQTKKFLHTKGNS